jgi:hypothetical protein
MSQLKEDIKQASDLGDDYIVQLDKYVPIKEYTANMDVTNYRVIKRIDSDVYDIHFYKKNRYRFTRKAVIKNNVFHVSRESNKRGLSLYNIYLVFTLFRR